MNRTILLVIVVIVGAAALAHVAYQNHKLDSRIDTLETELASRPAMGDIVAPD